MAKTNKETRSDFSKEMRDNYNERNEQLSQIDKLPISEELKEQSRRAIIENFEKQMDEIKSKPWYQDANETHIEEIQAKNRLNKARQELKNAEKSYEEAQVAHRGKVENRMLENDAENTIEIPEDLKNYRKAWKEKIRDISEENKEKIIKVADKIPVKVEIDSDGSRLIEFNLWGKTRKILDPELEAHSDSEYFVNYNDTTWTYKWVELWWMIWDDVDWWKNQKLKEYVREKQWEWLHIAKIEEMVSILKEFRKEVGLDDVKDQIAMLMYLTGMDWNYRLSMWSSFWSGSEESRYILCCYDNKRLYDYVEKHFSDNVASLCMIASE